MSYITDVLIIAVTDETEAITHINQWLASREGRHLEELREISLEAAGGYKATTLHVWAAAFNYLDAEAMTDVIEAAPWKYPRRVAVYFDPEDTTFVVAPARPGEMWETGP